MIESLLFVINCALVGILWKLSDIHCALKAINMKLREGEVIDEGSQLGVAKGRK